MTPQKDFNHSVSSETPAAEETKIWSTPRMSEISIVEDTCSDPTSGSDGSASWGQS